MNEKKNTGSGVLVSISTIISIITASLVAWNTVTVNKFETELKKVESERELNFRIYKSIAEALESENEKRIRAVRAIVEVMASENLRPGFLEALESAEVQIYEKEEATKPVVPRSRGNQGWKKWNFDVFWCSSSASSGEAIAMEIVSVFDEKEIGNRIRLRILPESVKKRSGFGIPKPFEIRVEKGQEKDTAPDIIKFIQENTAIQDSFNIFQVSSKYPTPGYVSIFVCPE